MEEKKILEAIRNIKTPKSNPLCDREVKIDEFLEQFKKEPAIIMYFKSEYAPPNKNDVAFESITFTLEYFLILKELKNKFPTSFKNLKSVYDKLVSNMKIFNNIRLKDLLSVLIKNKVIEYDRITSQYYPTKYYDMGLVLFEKYLETRKYYLENISISEIAIFETQDFTKAQLLRWLIEWVFLLWLVQTKNKVEFSWTELNQYWKEFNKKQKLPRNYKTDLKYIDLTLKLKAFDRNPANRKYVINKEFTVKSGKFLYYISVHFEILKMLLDINAYFPAYFYRMFFGRCIDKYVFGPEAIKATFEYFNPAKSVILVTPIIIWEHSDSPLLKVSKLGVEFEIILYFVPKKGTSSDHFIKTLIKNGVKIKVCLEEEINYPSLLLIDDNKLQIRPLNVRTDSMTPLGFIYSTDEILVGNVRKEIEQVRIRSYEYEYVQKLFDNLYKYCIKGKKSYMLSKKQRQFLINKGILTSEKLKLTSYGELLISRYY